MDDIRDKFNSDEEWDDFNNMYNDYKNQSGDFDIENELKKYIEKQIKIENYVYKHIVEKGKKFVVLPYKLLGIKNCPLCVFEFQYKNLIVIFTQNLN